MKNWAGGILLGLLLAPTAIAAQATPPDAREILAKAKQASGGDAWDGIRSTHTQVKLTYGGMIGTAESWEDRLKGRYVDRYKLGPISGANGFDGETVWSQDPSGQPRVEGGEDARQGAVNEAYRPTLAYWYPDRWPATMEAPVEREDGGKRYYVLRITPKGGRPFDIWVNAETYLADRVVEKAAIETRTVYFSDYRLVDGVKLPFAERSTNGDAKYDQLITVEKNTFNVPLEDAQFRMPAPPPPDFAFREGKTSTTVPFELLNNHIYVQVKLNGKGPFRVLCDTGGSNIVTPTVAKALGLKPEGALQGRGVGEKSEDIGLTKIETTEVGDISLSNQIFATFPLESFANAEGVPQSGLIGYEVFKRFIVEVDYGKHLLTLTLPSAFSYHGSGVIVPFKFNGHIPQIDGEIDGIPGKFDIDTGSRSSLDLLGPFVEKHNLKAQYAPEIEATTGWGVGGAARSLVTRAKVLRLGGIEVDRPVTELSLQTKGAFIDPYVAGNVGAGVLKRFNIIFDYGHQQLIFERNGEFDTPDVFDRSGMWLNLGGSQLDVMDVVAEGPAAQAGIKPGDKVLAIDGRTASQLLLPEVRARFKSQPPGTKVKLTVQSGDQKRDVVLVLKDLV